MYRIERTTVKQVYHQNRAYKIGHPLTILHAHTWLDYCRAAKEHVTPEWRYDVDAAILESVKPNPDFAAKVQKLRQSVRMKISQHHQVTQWRYDVCGSTAIDFGAAFAGVPECVLRRAKEPSHKTVRMLFSPEVQIDSHPDALALRGAVLAELCDLLARHQIRTEIITGFDTEYALRYYESWVRIKAINAPLNLSALWFPFQSPSFLGTLERQMIHHKNILGSPGMSHSSGMTCPADIVIASGANDETSKHFSSLEAATKWAAELFEKIKSGKF